MTFHQAKRLILRECSIKTNEDSFDSMILTLLYAKDKVNEKELIVGRIKELKDKGYSKKQTADHIRYEFAKSKNRAYEIIKESGYYG